MAAEQVPRPNPSSPDVQSRIAEALLGYHQSLPRFREDIDTMSGQILGLHGLIAKLSGRIEDIAHKFGVDRRAIDPMPDFDFDEGEPTHVGSNYRRVPSGTLQKMKDFITEQQLAAKLAKEQQEKAERDADIERKKSKAARDRVLFWIALASAIGGAVVYALEHLSFH